MAEDGDQDDQSVDKTCLVCGDRALSCNFGAITCESCKAFFRRNAAKEWSSKCDGHCPITVETRSYCKKCRLIKCLEVGMNRSLILSEEQKKLRKQKIIENKIKRSGQLGSMDLQLNDTELKRQFNPTDYSYSRPEGLLRPHSEGLLRPHSPKAYINQGLPDMKPVVTPALCNVKPYVPQGPPKLEPLCSDPRDMPALQEIKQEVRLKSDGLYAPSTNHPGRLIPPSYAPSSTDQATSYHTTAPSTQAPPSTAPAVTPTVSPSSANLSPVEIAPMLSYPSGSSQGSPTSPDLCSPPDSSSLRTLMSSEGPPHNYAHMFPQESGYNPENKKLRTDSSDSGSSSQSEFPQTGIVATTLKVLMDSDNFRLGLQDLPDPIVAPDYSGIFQEANLTVDNRVFMKHMRQLQYAASTAFTSAKKNNKCPKDPSYVQIFNFSEASIKCLVTLAKNLEPFLALTTDDQILLLKNSILEMMVLGSAASYDHKNKGWVIMDGLEVKTVQTTTVKSTREGKILMGHYEMIILYVLSASRRDLGINVLLTVLTLFSMQGQRAQCEFEARGRVEEGYKIYLNVLKIYTSIKYPDRPHMMENLLRSLDVVRDFSETYMQSILKSPLNKISPLLLEIFDLPLP